MRFSFLLFKRGRYTEQRISIFSKRKKLDFKYTVILLFLLVQLSKLQTKHWISRILRAPILFMLALSPPAHIILIIKTGLFCALYFLETTVISLPSPPLYKLSHVLRLKLSAPSWLYRLLSSNPGSADDFRICLVFATLLFFRFSP